MILLTVGMERYPFNRLVQAFDEICGQAGFDGGAFAQIGSSTYQPKHVAAKRYLPFPELESCLERCDVFVCHAGAGSVLSAIRHRRKCIVVPRLHKHGEHVDDHQLDLARRFDEAGAVTLVNDLSCLEAEIHRQLVEEERVGFTHAKTDELVDHIESLVETSESQEKR